MELSKVILDGITFAGDVKVISNSTFDKLITQAFKTVLSSATDDSCGEFHFDDVKESKGLTKQSFASLMTLIVEAAKFDFDGQMLKAQLEGCQFDETRIAAVIKLYDSNKHKIRSLLGNYGHQHPHIVNVDWRQDFVIKSSWLSKVGELRYIIELETEKTGSQEHQKVTFSCSLEDLQTLVDKLKDASKSITRNAQM